MSTRHAVTTFLPAAALALAMFTASAEAKLVCKPMVWGNGTHANQNIAKVHALGAWTTKAKNSYGAVFGNYAAAKSKSQNCRRTRPGPNAKFDCVVKGRPCANIWGPSGKESG